VRPYAGAIGPDFLLMDDNAIARRARIVQDYLQRETIERMDWPARYYYYYYYYAILTETITDTGYFSNLGTQKANGT